MTKAIVFFLTPYTMYIGNLLVLRHSTHFQVLTVFSFLAVGMYLSQDLHASCSSVYCVLCTCHNKTCSVLYNDFLPISWLLPRSNFFSIKQFSNGVRALRLKKNMLNV